MLRLSSFLSLPLRYELVIGHWLRVSLPAALEFLPLRNTTGEYKMA